MTLIEAINTGRHFHRRAGSIVFRVHNDLILNNHTDEVWSLDVSSIRAIDWEVVEEEEELLVTYRDLSLLLEVLDSKLDNRNIWDILNSIVNSNMRYK